LAGGLWQAGKETGGKNADYRFSARIAFAATGEK
jgi:hypothetical protein